MLICHGGTGFVSPRLLVSKATSSAFESADREERDGERPDAVVALRLLQVSKTVLQ